MIAHRAPNVFMRFFSYGFVVVDTAANVYYGYYVHVISSGFDFSKF